MPDWITNEGKRSGGLALSTHEGRFFLQLYSCYILFHIQRYIWTFYFVYFMLSMFMVSFYPGYINPLSESLTLLWNGSRILWQEM